MTVYAELKDVDNIIGHLAIIHGLAEKDKLSEMDHTKIQRWISDGYMKIRELKHVIDVILRKQIEEARNLGHASWHKCDEGFWCDYCDEFSKEETLYCPHCGRMMDLPNE